MKFCIISVIGTLYCATAVDGGVSTKEAVSNHLPLIQHETFANVIDTLRAGRIHAAASRKLEGHTTNGDAFHMFAKSAKDAKSKSAKAYSKGQKEDSSLFSSCADVQAELDTYKAAASEPQWLFVQMADMCVMYLKDGVYYLESSNFHKDTEWFTDRPFNLEETQPTSEWFENFNEVFDDGNGMPNAALTFVDDDESKDVVVSVFAEGYIKEGEDDDVLTYGYKLDQSNEQETVVALESLMGGKDSIEFDHCSMFIDGCECIGPYTCPWCRG